MLVLKREENRSTQRKTSQTKGENQQQTQPNNHCSDLNPGIIGGRQVFSPLPHPCSHNPSFTMGVNLGLISFYRSRWWVKGGGGGWWHSSRSWGGDSHSNKIFLALQASLWSDEPIWFVEIVRKAGGWGFGVGFSHMKGAGMLIISLRGVNFRFWSPLGCSGQNTIIFSHKGLF